MLLRLRPVVLALSLAGAALQPAFAQTPPVSPPAGQPGASPGAGGRFDPARYEARRAEKQAALRQKLQLSPAQEASWLSFTQVMQPPADRAARRAEMQSIAQLPTPDRIDRIRALRQTRIAEMDRRGDATKAFYAQLTPEQKRVFDDEARTRWSRHGGHGMHRGRAGKPDMSPQS